MKYKVCTQSSGHDLGLQEGPGVVQDPEPIISRVFCSSGPLLHLHRQGLVGVDNRNPKILAHRPDSLHLAG